MASFERFEEIEAWQTAQELTRAIYRVSRRKAFARDFALRDQMRKAAISISSNIAEGHERDSDKAFAHFLAIAKGSAGEVRSQLYVAHAEGYVDQEEYDRIYELAMRAIRQISGLRRYLRRSLQEQ